MSKQQKFLVLLIFISGIIIMILYYPQFNNIREFNNYSILFLSYLICGPLIISQLFRSDYYIFEPFTIVSALYIVIMIFQPMFDIVNGNFYTYGKDIMDGCFWGTFVFTISFIAFSIGYNIKPNKQILSNTILQSRSTISISPFNYSKKIRQNIYLIWLLGAVCALLFFVFSGRNITNALTLGLLGPQVEPPDESTVKFLFKLSYLMIIPWIFVIHFDKDLFFKIMTTIFMVMYFSAIGSRVIIVVIIIGVLVVPYLLKMKSISFSKIFILLSILLVISSVIAFYRGTTRRGGTINLSGFSTNAVTDVFETNFTIYRAYYAVIMEIPQKMPYQLGRGLIFYSLVSFIPSIIFPYKRNFDNVSQIIRICINDNAAYSGLAYINLGQYYAEFGIFGCFICMFIFGLICSRLKNLYLSKPTISSIILYSVLMPFLMQIVTRGDLAQQIGSLIGIVPPYFIINHLTKPKSKDIN